MWFAFELLGCSCLCEVDSHNATKHSPRVSIHCLAATATGQTEHVPHVVCTKLPVPPSCWAGDAPSTILRRSCQDRVLPCDMWCKTCRQCDDKPWPIKHSEGVTGVTYAKHWRSGQWVAAQLAQLAFWTTVLETDSTPAVCTTRPNHTADFNGHNIAAIRPHQNHAANPF